MLRTKLLIPLTPRLPRKMKTATVVKSNPPKMRRTPFGLKNDFFVLFDDGCKAMVDARHLADFRVENNLTIEAEPSNGWLDVTKKTPYVINTARRSITLSFNDLRCTTGDWEFDVVVDNERYIGSVEGPDGYVVYNALLYTGTAMIKGDWTPKSRHYVRFDEMQYENYWHLDGGAMEYDRVAYDRTVSFGSAWSVLTHLPDPFTLARLRDCFEEEAGLSLDIDVLVYRVLWRNAYQRCVFELLLKRCKPEYIYYSPATRLWRFNTGSCSLTTTGRDGDTVLISSPAGSFDLKLAGNIDEFEAALERFC